MGGSSKDRPKNQKRDLVKCHCWYTPVPHKIDKYERIYVDSCKVHKRWDPKFPIPHDPDFPPQPIEP